jgi:D-lactate dehydrogenase
MVRVPEYSPFAVAEHTVALILTLSRKIHRAYNRIKELNFSLDGLVGFDLHGKTVGVLGTGRIGATFAKIMNGFGCRVLAYDAAPNHALSSTLNLTYVPLDELLSNSHIVSLHLPLTPGTRHILDQRAFSLMRSDALLINTGRGALIDTVSLIDALKHHRIGGAGLDVYEEEEGVFFEDLSESGLQDDVLARLITFPNVIVTSHQAFLTKEALKTIAETTLQSLSCFEKGLPLENEVK